MAARLEVSRAQFKASPHLRWNAYVELLANSDYDDLTDAQRVAYLAFWYDNEVQNGGHLQYFENCGTSRLDGVIASLERLGANDQAQVLSRARARVLSLPKPRIRSVAEFVERALQGDFDDLDSAYYGCDPPVTDLLERFLDRNEGEFIKWVD